MLHGRLRIQCVNSLRIAVDAKSFGLEMSALSADPV